MCDGSDLTSAQQNRPESNGIGDWHLGRPARSGDSRYSRVARTIHQMPLQFELDWDAKLPPSAQAGMADADAHADLRWKRYVDGCIQLVARQKEEFTVDDVILALEALPERPSTHNLGALGPRMREVSKTLRYMEPTDRVQRSKRQITHGNLHRIWRSKLYAS